MASRTRRIGLSPGADICWPICYEALLRKLDPVIPHGRDAVKFEVERIYIEPFDLGQPCRYDVVIDRLAHWYHTTREWLKKAILTDDLYVFNNPWSLQSMDHHTACCAMIRMGFPVPATWLIPPKAYAESAELEPTLTRYARLFDLGSIGEAVGYPLFVKPYDGGGAATAAHDRDALLKAYDVSATRIMHLQKAIQGSGSFVRCMGLGPQWRCMRFDPAAAPQDRYHTDVDFLSTQDENHLASMTMAINAFFGRDFNVCESLFSNGAWYAIEFSEPCPATRVSTLHVHFPWLVKAKLRWSVFCAATQRRMHLNHDWTAYFRIADQYRPFDEKLADYAKIAQDRYDADRFYEFCEKHLGDLDAVAIEFFGSEDFRDAVRQELATLLPAHETQELTEVVWRRVQAWRDQDERLAS